MAAAAGMAWHRRGSVSGAACAGRQWQKHGRQHGSMAWHETSVSIIHMRQAACGQCRCCAAVTTRQLQEGT